MRGSRGIPFLAIMLFSIAALGLFGYSRVRGEIEDPAHVGLKTEALSLVCAALTADHEAAYQALDMGDVWRGATTLVHSLRKIPGDDPQFINDELVDAGVGATRFAVYIMSELMDEEMRQQFVETALDPVYPTDELVQLQYEVTHAPTSERAVEIVKRLLALTEGTNPSARVASLAILAAPYSFELWPHRPRARHALVENYTGLAITRTVLQWSLDACRAKGDGIAEAMAKVVNEELTSRREQQILLADPASSRTIVALPSLLKVQSRRDGVASICGGIINGTDWKTRFACINQAVGFGDIGHRDQIENALETLVASGLDTPDTVRAKCLLLGYARDNGDIERVRYWGDQLLGTRRITDTIDRTLHEEVGNAIQFYAEFLEKNGMEAQAAAVYARLGGKFPNSVLAEKCQHASKVAMQNQVGTRESESDSGEKQ